MLDKGSSALYTGLASNPQPPIIAVTTAVAKATTVTLPAFHTIRVGHSRLFVREGAFLYDRWLQPHSEDSAKLRQMVEGYKPTQILHVTAMLATGFLN